MDYAKTGHLIASLRNEKELTQQQVADALGITNKTVSKWECGLGLPDTSLWPDLSVILGVDMTKLLAGEMPKNKPDNGNINRAKFYVCPKCNNALMSTGDASIYCCGRRLLPEIASPGEKAIPIKVELIDNEYYVTADHPMIKEDFILFAAYVKADKVFFLRLYPEQSNSFRIPYWPKGNLYLFSTTKGLVEQKINI